MISAASSIRSLRLIVLLDILVTLIGVYGKLWAAVHSIPITRLDNRRFLLSLLLIWNLVIVASLIPYAIHFQKVYDRSDRADRQQSRPFWIMLVVLLILFVVRTLGCAILLFVSVPPIVNVFTSAAYLVIQGYAACLLAYVPYSPL